MSAAIERRRTASISPRPFFLIFALLLTAAVAIVAYLVPLNCNDFLQHLFYYETHPFSDTFQRRVLDTHTDPGSEWRPLQYTTSHALYFVAKGHEHLVFKGLLAACIAATGWLFARLTSPLNWRDAVAAMTALMILYGHQSFAGAVEGVYPYGVEIILVGCELVVLGVLIRGRPSPASEIAIVAISLFAILLNEKGALIGATYIAGALVKLPGASRRAAVGVFLVYVAVVAARFGYFRTISRRSERTAQSASDILFDLIAPALNVLISDPRHGRFRTFPQAFVWGQPWAIVTVISSLTTLALVFAWVARTFDRKDVSIELRVAALLPALLAGSMVFGMFSRKDYLPIMALPVYALTCFYAMRWMFRHAVLRVAVAVGIVLVAGWAIRTAGLFYYMHRIAYDYQEEWRDAERHHARFNIYDRSMGMPILERLRAEANTPRLTHTDYLLPKWLVLTLRGRGCPEFCGNYD